MKIENRENEKEKEGERKKLRIYEHQSLSILAPNQTYTFN